MPTLIPDAVAQHRQHLAVYPGSFDPLTLGHLDIITRATQLFDALIVGVAHNPAKAGRYYFDLDTRVELVRVSTAHLPGVEVDVIPGLVARYCAERGAVALVKGLRSGIDLEHEMPMAHMNRRAGGPDTLFLPARPEVAHISSSLVKELASWGGQISDLVPPAVCEAFASHQ